MPAGNIQIMCLSTGQQCPANFNLYDQMGNPFVPTGIPVWTSGDATIASAVAAADGLSATITAIAQGETFITVTADGESAMLCVQVEDLNPSWGEIIPGGV